MSAPLSLQPPVKQLSLTISTFSLEGTVWHVAGYAFVGWGGGGGQEVVHFAQKWKHCACACPNI
jgi:hypothetical protein